MTLAWPIDNDFPQQMLVESNSCSLSSAVVETEMESGPPHARLKDTVTFDTFSGVIYLNNTQRAAFLSFFYTDTAQGVIPFQWQNPITGDTANYRIIGQPSLVSLGAGRHKCTLTVREVPS